MKTQDHHHPSLNDVTIRRRPVPPTDAGDDATTEELQSINPVDDSVIGATALTTPNPAIEKVIRAREAQQGWRRTPLQDRIQRGRSLFHEVLGWRQELLDLVVDETGKNQLEARWELWKTADELGDLFDHAQEALAPQRRGKWWTPGRAVQWSWQPRGVVLIIASAYDPIQTTLAPALAALLAGNAVVILADRRAPLVVESIDNIINATGLPDDLWTSLVGGTRVLDALADRVDAVVSYGSSTVTRRLARRQGDRMIPVLGRWDTHDVMIVLNDAPIERAARSAVCAACGGAGRRRRALRRIYVQEGALPDFVDAVVEEVGALRQGENGRDDPMNVGPLFEREELEIMERLVDAASDAGARLVAGGRPRPRSRGLFFEPTVLTGVDESMAIWKTPTPGPVVAIASVQAPAEAVRRTRDGDGYGAVSIFSRNRSVASSLAARLNAPVVGINEVVCDVPATAPPVRGTHSSPVDPLGSDRLQAMSRRVLQVERGWSALPGVLETPRPFRMVKTLDAALSLAHRRSWLHKTLGDLF